VAPAIEVIEVEFAARNILSGSGDLPDIPGEGRVKIFSLFPNELFTNTSVRFFEPDTGKKTESCAKNIKNQ